MEWSLRTDLPIYSQLVEQIRLAIVSGKLHPGEKIASVRDLASEAGVNPNTMQRALQELEREGMVFAQRTSGRYVTEELQIIEKAKVVLAEKQVQAFLITMQNLGYSSEEVINLLQSRKETKDVNS
ncbi:MAG: GntR family transcriptional regulator [Oscillospiraceae bacterium]|nr:GntR family transcriptional regulator [Oscillospiraceae bacterium]